MTEGHAYQAVSFFELTPDLEGARMQFYVTQNRKPAMRKARRVLTSSSLECNALEGYEDRRMQALKIATRVFCVLPFATGVADLINGVGVLGAAGFHAEESVANDPVLNSQVKFWGAIWLGYGATLWRTSSRLREDEGLFRLLCGVLFLSGLGRLASAVQYGRPGRIFTGAMVIELFSASIAFLWHGAELNKSA